MVALAEISCAEGKAKHLCGRRARCVKNCGYRYDAETVNYYVRNRYHSPTLGRWLSRDPIGYQGGIALYEYAYDAPTKRADPRGLQGSPAIALAEAIAAGDVAEVRTILQAAGDILSKSEVEAADGFLAQNAKCLALYAAYKALKCKGCQKVKCTTKAEALARAACLSAEIAGRGDYLKNDCDYILAGSIAEGSAKKKALHEGELVNKGRALAACLAAAARLP